MHTINKIKYILLLTLCSYTATAQTFSYLYIQGDKETPIYVKMEGEMQPRYGKDYCIISQLAPGPVHIQVLFQQNTYPAQDFLLSVPNNGYRGFIVTHRGDNFSLYDLQRRVYIPAGNTIEEDENAVVTDTQRTIAENVNEVPGGAKTIAANVGNSVITDAVSETGEATKKTDMDSLVSAVNKKHKKADREQPKFIDNLLLDNEKTPQKVNDIPAAPTPREPVATITNSDCPNPMQDRLLDEIHADLTERKGNERLKYLLQNIKRYCFSCAQVRVLARELATDHQRYAFMKQVYPRVTDQTNFGALINLFTTDEGKSYFQLITQ